MDRGVFFLAATVVGAGIGYLIGKSYDEGTPRAVKILGIWNARMGSPLGTAVGALLGAAAAATYLYLELMARIVVWGGEACANHPFRVLAVTALFIAVAYTSLRRGNRNRFDDRNKFA